MFEGFERITPAAEAYMVERLVREGSDPLAVLGGTGLRVYLYMLSRRRPVTPRELQRALGFRSISTAYHHLERLERMGLVEKRGEGYVARRPAGILGAYLVLHGKLVPHHLITASIATGAALGYTLALRDPLAALLLWLLALLSWRDFITLYRAAQRLAGSGD